MADVLIQFHALLDELAVFLVGVLDDLDVHVTALRFQPFRAEPVGKDDIELALRDPAVRELVLTLDPPGHAVLDAAAFASRNPSALRLDLGRRSERGLGESCLSARTKDERALEVWKQIARKLRRITLAGALAMNPATGATSRLRSHRFTAGAKALHDDGVAMLPVAGGAVLRLGSTR